MYEFGRIHIVESQIVTLTDQGEKEENDDVYIGIVSASALRNQACLHNDYNAMWCCPLLPEH